MSEEEQKPDKKLVKQPQQNKYADIMTNTIIIGTILLSVGYYWFVARPNTIKRNCKYLYDENGVRYNTANLNEYNQCLEKHGLNIRD